MLLTDRTNLDGTRLHTIDMQLLREKNGSNTTFKGGNTTFEGGNTTFKGKKGGNATKIINMLQY